MIVLDTNVVSEAMKPEPDIRVQIWFDEQVVETLYLTSITVAEVMYGIGALPKGKRQDRLQAAFEGLLTHFVGRILPFDTDAARCYADLAVKARVNGKGFPTPDGYIAAISVSQGFAVASRDTSAYSAAGLAVINPWTVQG